MARAESERGELVLRERTPDGGAPSVLELRANGVFVMDTAEHASELALADAALAPGRHPAAGAGRRARASASPSTGCSATAGSSSATWSRSSPLSSSGCATAPSPTVRGCSPTSRVARSSSRTSRPRSPRPRPRRTTWSCSTSTTAPATWSTRATPRSTARRSSRGARRGSRPAAPSPSGPRRRDPELDDTSAGLRRGRGARHDVRLQDRDDQYWLYVGRAGRPRAG